MARAKTVAQADPRTPSCRETGFAVNQQPVHQRIDDVRGDERHHDRADDAHALQIATKSCIEKQRQNAPREDVEIGTCHRQHSRIEAPGIETGADPPEQPCNRHTERDGEDDAVDEPSMAVLHIAGTEGLRDESIEPEEESHRKDAHAHEDRRAHPHCTNGFGTERPDDQRIDHPHRHPAKLRENNRNGKTEHRLKFLAQLTDGGKRRRHQGRSLYAPRNEALAADRPPLCRLRCTGWSEARGDVAPRQTSSRGGPSGGNTGAAGSESRDSKGRVREEPGERGRGDLARTPDGVSRALSRRDRHLFGSDQRSIQAMRVYIGIAVIATSPSASSTMRSRI